MISKIFNELKTEIVSKKKLPDCYLVSRGNDNGFENLIKEKIVPKFNKEIRKIIPNHTIKLVPQFGSHFPDLDLYIDNELYGIELKSRKDGSWRTQGGSAFESTSQGTYKEIYLLFASRNKDDTSYRVRWAPYWKATEAIKVTHSPRFSINLDAKSSVFKSNDEYNNFHNLTKEKKNKFIQKKLASTVSKPTWYSNPNEVIDPTSFNKLSKTQKGELITELLVLFPRDLLQQPKANYDPITKYLLSEHYTFSSSTRDIFSAGGKTTIKGTKFPKIIDTYRVNRDSIASVLKNNSSLSNIAYSYWKISKKSTALEDFKSILDKLGNKYFSSSLSNLNLKLSELIFAS